MRRQQQCAARRGGRTANVVAGAARCALQPPENARRDYVHDYAMRYYAAFRRTTQRTPRADAATMPDVVARRHTRRDIRPRRAVVTRVLLIEMPNVPREQEQ
jgi:hypothetical protein